MSPVAVYPSSSATAKLIVVICFFWPFLAASFLSRRTTSAGPVAAVLVPLALSVAGMLWGLNGTLGGLSTSEPPGAAAAAGIAEAFSFPGLGALFALLVIIVAAIRRHRPFVDRLCVVLFALLAIEIGLALFIGSTIGRGRWQFYACVTGAIAAGVMALTAAVWTFLTGRGRVSSRPLPYAIPVVAVVCVVIGIILWQSMRHYVAIAMFGWT